jgi:hypothetical protein
LYWACEGREKIPPKKVEELVNMFSLMRFGKNKKFAPSLCRVQARNPPLFLSGRDSPLVDMSQR